MNQPLPDKFSVGECRVFPPSNELQRGDIRVQLEPKVMALLLHLVKNAGDTVSREQLFEAVWPGVVVSDDTLTQAVIKLRKALGDSAKNARYIQTVPKRGYRLLAPVKVSLHKPPLLPSTPRKRLLFAATAMLVLLAGALIVQFTHDDEARSLSKAIPTGEETDDRVPTLTVQPFVLLGTDESQAYLAQGLTLDLITDLSRLSALRVIGSRSIMGQKADESGAVPAHYRVQGEVQRADGRIRVHVHLLDAGSGRRIWSERYQRPFDNLFQLQEEISRQIVATLSLKVNEAEQQRMAHRYTRSVPAYELFLQAQPLLLVRLKTENERARRLYRQAITLDPSFARAYAGLALSYAADYRNQWRPDGDQALEEARRMARTALQIDPEIAEVYWVLAYVSAQQKQHDKALGLLRKAVSLDRSFADAYALMGGIHTYMGLPGQTPALIRTAIRLNPEAGYLYFLLLGRAYFFQGDWEQAVLNLDEALERNPANLEAHLYRAAALESSGDHEGAVWEQEEILALQADFGAEAWLSTYPMTDRGQLQQLLTALSASGLAVK